MASYSKTVAQSLHLGCVDYSQQPNVDQELPLSQLLEGLTPDILQELDISQDVLINFKKVEQTLTTTQNILLNTLAETIKQYLLLAQSISTDDSILANPEIISQGLSLLQEIIVAQVRGITIGQTLNLFQNFSRYVEGYERFIPPTYTEVETLSWDTLTWDNWDQFTWEQFGSLEYVTS